MKPKKLLKTLSSGVQKYFPEPEGTQLSKRIATLYDGYCREHSDDPPMVKQHTEGMIYGGAALYQALLEKGLSPEEALAQTDQIFQDFAQEAAEKLRSLLKFPRLYRRVPWLFQTMVRKKYNQASGFQMNFYHMERNRVKFDVTACPYFVVCQSLGVPELTTIFCNTDDCCYGNMHPKLKWNRTTTIGRGGDVCDFDLMVQD